MQVTLMLVASLAGALPNVRRKCHYSLSAAGCEHGAGKCAFVDVDMFNVLVVVGYKQLFT